MAERPVQQRNFAERGLETVADRSREWNDNGHRATDVPRLSAFLLRLLSMGYEKIDRFVFLKYRNLNLPIAAYKISHYRVK